MANDRREEGLVAIRAKMEHYGPSYKWADLHQAEFSDVPLRTFYRWVNAVKAKNDPVLRVSKKIRDKAHNRAKREGSKAKGKEAAVGEVERHMPRAPTVDEVANDGLIPAIERINQCIQHGEKVLAMYELEPGKIRNPKMYLHASRHILQAMQVAAQIVDVLNDAHRTDQFHRAILDRLRQRDPEFVEQVLDDLRRLNQEWGAV